MSKVEYAKLLNELYQLQDKVGDIKFDLEIIIEDIQRMEKESGRKS